MIWGNGVAGVAPDRYRDGSAEERLKASRLIALPEARFGAVTFVHRFGFAVNAILHFDEIRPFISRFGSLLRSQSAPGRLVIVRSSMMSSVPMGKGCNFVLYLLNPLHL